MWGDALRTSRAVTSTGRGKFDPSTYFSYLADRPVLYYYVSGTWIERNS